MLASIADVSLVLRAAARSHDMQTRLNSIHLAGQAGSESLAHLFALGLTDPQPKARDAAAAAMVQMARRLLAEHALLAGKSRLADAASP